MSVDISIQLLGFEIDEIEQSEQLIRVHAHTTALSARCSSCEHQSWRVHSTYTRYPADLPVIGQVMRLILQVKRFFCDNPGCQKRTFVEPLTPLIPKYARRTERLTDTLRLLSIATSGELASRLAKHLGMLISSPATLLRIIRNRALPQKATPRVLGVDDWAFKRGHHYGTILVDLEAQEPIDLLSDREAETVATWLKEHPGIEVVSRDRSSEYKAGITEGAPQAIQIADRWHLLRNWGDALQRLLARHPKVLRTASQKVHERIHGIVTHVADNTEHNAPSADEVDQPKPLSYRQMRFDEVKTLAAQGLSRRAIARQLHMHRQTVARYLESDKLPERISRSQNVSSVTPYFAYIKRRWAEGCENGKQLWREIQQQGFTGSYMSVMRAIKKFRPTDGRRQQSTTMLPTPSPLSPRQAMWLLVRAPEDLSEEQVIQRDELCAGCPDAAVAYPLAQRFMIMIRERQADFLDSWLNDVENSGISTLRNFATGLRRDYEAVKAALSFEWSNGQVEGQVNRLKLIKRQMYGRANFDLLRAKVLTPV